MKHADGVASAQSAFCLHSGIGLYEVVESAIEHYAFALQQTPLYLAVNSFRCLRAVNKQRSHILKVPPPPPQTPVPGKRTSPLEIRLSIKELRAPPIGPAQGRILGRGGFGLVTLERHPFAKKQIAVKHLSTATTSVRLFEREVESLVQLQHPCIVRIFGWSPATAFCDGEIHMEYAPNGSVATLLSNDRDSKFWTPTRIGILICDIVLGMRYVHSKGILHRDLKGVVPLLEGR
jgi:hypothetical protein